MARASLSRGTSRVALAAISWKLILISRAARSRFDSTNESVCLPASGFWLLASLHDEPLRGFGVAHHDWPAGQQRNTFRVASESKELRVDCTLHLIDEKQYREIYVPAVAGDEAALNQLLEWASLLSAGWESRSEAYRLVKDLRIKWKAAIEARGLGEGGRTVDFGKNLNYVYGT